METDFADILKATGKQLPSRGQKKLKEQLNKCAIVFLQDYGAEKRDPPSTVKKRLDDIASAADKIIKLTKIRDGASARVRLNQAAENYQTIRVRTSRINKMGEREEYADPSPYPTVVTAIKAVEALWHYAKYASSDERRKITTTRNRNKGNVARKKFINALAAAWPNTPRQSPGTSVNPETGEVGGPFVRFVMACYKPLRREFPGLPALNETAIRNDLRRSKPVKRIKSSQKKI